MNLRHIDPGSTDWMDAMLEGESARKPKGEVEAKGDQLPDAEVPHLLVGGNTATSQSLGSPPGRGSR